MERANGLAWLPVLAVGALIGWADLHQTDTPVTVGLLLIFGFAFAVGTRLPWFAVGLAVAAFVPAFNLAAAFLHLQVSGTEHGQIITWTPRLGQASGSLLALVFGVAGAAAGHATRRFVFERQTAE